jgi:hypothetical protein
MISIDMNRKMELGESSFFFDMLFISSEERGVLALVILCHSISDSLRESEECN